jgi:hypothetical protein
MKKYLNFVSTTCTWIEKKTESERERERNTEKERNREKTRTAWAVFKYCGTKTVTLRMIKNMKRLI